MQETKRPAASTGGDLPAAEAARAKPLPGNAVRETQAQLDRILASEAFSHSERLSRFLRFITTETVGGRAASLKEYQIGVEVFDKKSEYDPRIDPIVRVEAARLRAKLEEYYRTAGQGDRIVIRLPKGSYVPVIEQAHARPEESQAPLRRRRLLLICVILLVCALGGGIALFVKNRQLETQLAAARTPPIATEFRLLWGKVLAPGARNVVIVGSPLFFSSDREQLFLRWAGAQGMPDYSAHPRFRKLQDRLGPLSGPRYDYALMGDTMALQRLTAFLARHSASLEAVPANLANWEMLQDSNLIFLGAPRMLPVLARLPIEQDFSWDADQNVVNRHPQSGEQATYVTSSHFDAVSYAVVARFPGLDPQHQIMLITDHSSPGANAALDHLTQPEKARALVERMRLAENSSADEYQLLLRVLLDKGSRIKSEYVTHHYRAPQARRQP